MNYHCIMSTGNQVIQDLLITNIWFCTLWMRKTLWQNHDKTLNILRHQYFSQHAINTQPLFVISINSNDHIYFYSNSTIFLQRAVLQIPLKARGHKQLLSYFLSLSVYCLVSGIFVVWCHHHLANCQHSRLAGTGHPL